LSNEEHRVPNIGLWLIDTPRTIKSSVVQTGRYFRNSPRHYLYEICLVPVLLGRLCRYDRNCRYSINSADLCERIGFSGVLASASLPDQSARKKQLRSARNLSHKLQIFILTRQEARIATYPDLAKKVVATILGSTGDKPVKELVSEAKPDNFYWFEISLSVSAGTASHGTAPHEPSPFGCFRCNSRS